MEKWNFTKSFVDLPKEFKDCVALKGENFVEEIHTMVGFASTLMAGEKVFEEQQALGLANELCLLVRKYERALERVEEIVRVARKRDSIDSSWLIDVLESPIFKKH